MLFKPFAAHYLTCWTCGIESNLEHWSFKDFTVLGISIEKNKYLFCEMDLYQYFIDCLKKKNIPQKMKFNTYGKKERKIHDGKSKKVLSISPY